MWWLCVQEILQAGRAASLKRKKLVRGRLVIDGTGLGLGSLRNMSILKRITSIGKVKRKKRSSSSRRAPTISPLFNPHFKNYPFIF
jgi:hypothetical protein